MSIKPNELNTLYKQKLFEIARSEDYFKRFMAFVGKTNLTIPHEQFMCFIQKPDAIFCIKKEEVEKYKNLKIYFKSGSKGIGYLNFQNDRPTHYYFDINDINVPRDIGNFFKVFQVPKDRDFISYFVKDYKNNGIDDEKKLFDYLQNSFKENKYINSTTNKTKEEQDFIEYYSIYAIFSKLNLDLAKCEELLKLRYETIDFKNVIGEIEEDRVREVYPMYGISKDIGKVVQGISKEIEHFSSIFPEEKRRIRSREKELAKNRENARTDEIENTNSIPIEKEVFHSTYRLSSDNELSIDEVFMTEQELKDLANVFNTNDYLTEEDKKGLIKDYVELVLERKVEDITEIKASSFFHFLEAYSTKEINKFIEKDKISFDDEKAKKVDEFLENKNKDLEYKKGIISGEQYVNDEGSAKLIDAIPKSLDTEDEKIIQSQERLTKLHLLGYYSNDFESTQSIKSSDDFVNSKENKDSLTKESLATDLEEDINSDLENIESRYNALPNFKITNEIQPEKLLPSERLSNNIEAIKTLRSLERSEIELDEKVQETLAKYVGWGGLADVFNENKEGQWLEARNFLKENLSEEEYTKARESTLTAFYTPKAVIDSIYKVLSDMGFDKGNILEPSAGIGNFIGNLPESMKESKVYGVELDSISGRIAGFLYPQSNIQVKRFEKTNFSNNFFDIAIGNVPFGDFKVRDKKYDRNNFLIHDYFFAKSIDKVRNGGIIAFITSSGTMDKKDESVRRYIAARAEFLGAIRLPNDTFKGVAGTEVKSDIIFLKKRDSIRERDEDWVHLSEDEKGLVYNKYFVDHPEQVLGTMREVSGRFGNTLACLPKENADLKELLTKAGTEISKNAKYEEIELLDDEITSIPATDDVKNFSYTIIDDEVYYRENSLFVKKEITDKNKEKIKDYLELNTALKDVIYKQKEDFSDDEVKKSQEKLNEVYDSFSKKHGYVNNLSNTRALKEDSNFPLVSSIEILDEEENFKAKGDIFSKRTITKAKTIDHVDTSLEALVLSVSEKGYVDFEYMENLTGKDRSTLIEELRGEIYLSIREEQNFYRPLSLNLEDGDLPFACANGSNSYKYGYVTKD